MTPAQITKKTKQIRRWLHDEGGSNPDHRELARKFLLGKEQALDIVKLAGESRSDLNYNDSRLEQRIYLILELGGSGSLWICSFLDKSKHVIDSVLYHAPNRDEARRQAVEAYLKKGDLGQYCGFIVQEEEHGGY